MKYVASNLYINTKVKDKRRNNKLWELFEDTSKVMNTEDLLRIN